MATFTRKVSTPCTWADVKEIIEMGRAAQDFAVGDEIAETLTTGEKVVFVVAGIDVYAKGQVIFSLKDCLEDEHCMNTDWTNKGGWPACDMRRYLREEVFETLPEDLRAVITPRTLKTDDGEATDALWLFSEFEIFGESWCDNDPGDKHIPYYENPVNRCKSAAVSANSWWERSPIATNTTYFCNVNSSGNASGNNASGARGVCFGFCI